MELIKVIIAKGRWRASPRHDTAQMAARLSRVDHERAQRRNQCENKIKMIISCISRLDWTRLGWGEHECDRLLGTRKGEGVRVVGASSHLFIKHFTLVGENLNNASHCCG